MSIQDTARRAASEMERIAGCGTWMAILKLVLPIGIPIIAGGIWWNLTTLNQISADLTVLTTRFEERLDRIGERDANQDSQIQRLNERLLYRPGPQ